jgi:hypothetical protein
MYLLRRARDWREEGEVAIVAGGAHQALIRAFTAACADDRWGSRPPVCGAPCGTLG